MTPPGYQMASSPEVTVAMLGARRHYAVPRLLNEAGLLKWFFTDSYSGNKRWVQRAVQTIPERVRPESLERWIGRSDPTIPPEKVVSFESLGWSYALNRRRCRTSVQIEMAEQNAAFRFARLVSAHRAFRRGEFFWGFDSAALGMFAAANDSGLRCIYEQTILPAGLAASWLMEETERWPGWEAREPGGVQRLSAARARREQQVWALAERIIAGSVFVRDALVQLGVPAERIRVVPYGLDTARFPITVDRSSGRSGSTRERPLRVLFAGEVGLRKGVPYLLEALRKLPHNAIECRLAGPISLAPDKLRGLPASAHLLGPVTRSRMPSLFQWADILALPSLVEGSAAVTYEALVSGVPVVATPNAGSQVRDGIDGTLIPVRDSHALVKALLAYFDNPDLLRSHQRAAQDGRQRLALEAYRDNLVRTVYELRET